MSIQVEITGSVAWVTLSRAEKRNAITPEMHETLSALWPRLEADPNVSVIVLTGAGDQAFCAGADIEEFLPYVSKRIAMGDDPGNFCGLTHRRLSKPTLAAINGVSFGGGFELALAADIRIASDNATFALPEVKIGAIAGAGGLARLSTMIPQSLATQMILTGSSITAQRAYELGLVSEVVPAVQLKTRVAEIVASIAANCSLAVNLSRDVAHYSATHSLADAMAFEREAFRKIVASDEFRSGIEGYASIRHRQSQLKRIDWNRIDDRSTNASLSEPQPLN